MSLTDLRASNSVRPACDLLSQNVPYHEYTVLGCYVYVKHCVMGGRFISWIHYKNPLSCRNACGVMPGPQRGLHGVTGGGLNHRPMTEVVCHTGTQSSQVPHISVFRKNGWELGLASRMDVRGSWALHKGCGRCLRRLIEEILSRGGRRSGGADGELSHVSTRRVHRHAGRDSSQPER